MSQRDYLLSDSASELERLRLQARVWEPETEAWLDRLGPMEGWHCIDLGCGAMSILGPLSRRAGPSGRIVGVDIDPMQLRGARAFVAEPPSRTSRFSRLTHTLPRFLPARLTSPTSVSSSRQSAGMLSS